MLHERKYGTNIFRSHLSEEEITLEIIAKIELAFKVLLTRYFPQYFLEILHYKGHFELQSNFFGGIFVTVFFVEIFNFIEYANNTTRDITLHDDF